MLNNCWQIKQCGREQGGHNAQELGVCPASTQSFGHSCWIIAGTLCGGVVQGTFAEKEKNCLSCEVYQLYNRTNGSQLDELRTGYVRECSEYNKMLLAVVKAKKLQ